MNWNVLTIAERSASALAEYPLLSLSYMIVAMISVAAILTASALVLIYAERKIAAHFQCRIGPMRVGWHGILQPIADALKLLSKEDLLPEKSDRFLFSLAPSLCVLATVLGLSFIPYSPSFQIIDTHIGIILITAVTSFGVLGILLGGYSSNNKWSMIGAMRAGAQIVSYELSATLSILVIVIFSQTFSLQEIVLSQQNGWWIWRANGVGLVAFIIFVIASVAELNRTPFDLTEGESELTAGFHTEYSGLRFSFFFLSEFVNMVVAAGLTTTLFLGGWMPFHIGTFELFNSIMNFIPPSIWFLSKVIVIIFFYMWIRWSFPRLRIDQLMLLEWKFLLPIGFVNVMIAGIIASLNLYWYP